MGVFHVFEIVQMEPNRPTHHIYNVLTQYGHYAMFETMLLLNVSYNITIRCYVQWHYSKDSYNVTIQFWIMMPIPNVL